MEGWPLCSKNFTVCGIIVFENLKLRVGFNLLGVKMIEDHNSARDHPLWKFIDIFNWRNKEL